MDLYYLRYGGDKPRITISASNIVIARKKGINALYEEFKRLGVAGRMYHFVGEDFSSTTIEYIGDVGIGKDGRKWYTTASGRRYYL